VPYGLLILTFETVNEILTDYCFHRHFVSAAHLRPTYQRTSV